MSDWIGQNLGKVRIEKLIARGGMAEVYQGTHISLNRPVAVKVLLGHLEDQPELKGRFEREARVLAGLRHPNIVQIYDFDFANSQPYIIMEYIEGPNLAAYLSAMHASGGVLTTNQIGRLMVMLAGALDYAHAKGVVHRDIKPANILMTSKSIKPIPGQPLADDTEPILSDFGLFRLTDGSTRSISGAIAGTPAYMSPEQARGDRVGPASDLYALGVVLYEMLSGRVPFEADTSMGVLMKHIQAAPPPIPNLPIALQNVLDRVLAKQPGDRYSTARELVRAYLEACGLTISDVAPGYSITPQPEHLKSRYERSTLAPATPPVAAPRQIRPLAAKPAAKSKRKKGISAWTIGISAMLAMLAGVCLLATIGSALWVFRDSLFGSPMIPITGETATVASSPTPEAHANHENLPTPASGITPEPTATFGRLRFYNSPNYLSEVILSVSGLPPAPPGFQYEAWLTGSEVRRSLGIVKLDGSGSAEITLVDEQGRNFLARYDRLEITLEPEPDPSPNPTGTVAFSSGIPPMALDHIKHLLVAFESTPNQTGMLIGLVQDATLLNEQSAAMLAAYQNQDAAEVRRRAEAMYNVLIGKQGFGYGDLDGDGQLSDPGDGYGMLLNGEQDGYIQGTISHAEFANGMPDAGEAIHHHTPHITDSAKNVESWTSELRDLLAVILSDPLGPNAEANVREAVALTDRILHGRDLNGNEIVDPVPGEGGALTALEHATYMIDMPIMSGSNMLPAPVANGTPSADPGGDYR